MGWMLTIPFMDLSKKLILLFILLNLHFNGYSQATETTFKKHEAGIDIANALTFIKRNTQSYLLNYRYHLNEKTALRAGLNLDISNGESEGTYPDIRVGIQKNKRSKSWVLYYGADLSYSYFKSNAVPNTTSRWGLSPLLGVQYFFNQRISLSTEASLNYYHFFVTNTNSFDPLKHRNYYRIVIGSVGMAVISYHF
jgi:hypothetical protein